MNRSQYELNQANNAVRAAAIRVKECSKAFGKYFRQQRKEHWIQQRIAAEWLWVSGPTLCKLERGQINWTDALAQRAVELLESQSK